MTFNEFRNQQEYLAKNVPDIFLSGQKIAYMKIDGSTTLNNREKAWDKYERRLYGEGANGKTILENECVVPNLIVQFWTWIE